MKVYRKVLIAGLVIIVMTNVIALLGVLYNRSGEPDAVVELTERELSLPYRYRFNDENTGLSLSLNCRLAEEAEYYSYASHCNGRPIWLDAEKLKSLGFDIDLSADQQSEYAYSDKYLSRPVYLVLEYDGDTYQRVLAKTEQLLANERELLTKGPDNSELQRRVENAEKRVYREQHNNSRLFAIDAGLDKHALRSHYSDSQRYLIVAGLVQPIWGTRDDKYQLLGLISDLLIDGVYIPLEYRPLFDSFQDEPTRHYSEKTDPRYRVKLAFGQRAEPWVLAVSHIQ